MNRKLTKFEIWLKKSLTFTSKVIICIILCIFAILSLNRVINFGLDREMKREDIAITQFKAELNGGN